MKLEEKELDKITVILAEAAEVAEAPFLAFAFKKEDSPQFEVKLVYPQEFQKIFENVIFLSSANPFLGEIYQELESKLGRDYREVFKNIAKVDELEKTSRQLRVKGGGICPLVFEKEAVGFLLFLCKEPEMRTLKIVESFARQIIYYIAFRDAQHRAWEASVKSQAVLEASSDAFFTIDTEGNHVYVSPSIEALTGYTPEEFIRGLITPERYVHPDDLQKVMGFYRDAFAGKKGGTEFRLIRKDGNVVWVSLFSNPVYDTKGRLIGIQGVERDISARKKAEWELEEAKEREKLKTEFMSVISHELRTPVTPIQGYVDVLLSGQLGELNPQQKEALLTIKKQSKRLLDLIDSVLDITRVEYGKPIEIKKEPVLINVLITEIVEGLKYQFQEKDIKLETDLSSEIETICADEAKIARVISNLLGNALKFTPKKGKVGIKTSKVGEEIKIEVWDSGIGLEKENLEKIFDKFFQVDSSYTRAAGGIGMGLAIAKEIVEAHKGKIWAESEGLGKGSRFIFTLPLL